MPLYFFIILYIFSIGFLIHVTFEAAEKDHIISLFLFFSRIFSNSFKSINHSSFKGQRITSHNHSLKLSSFEWCSKGPITTKGTFDGFILYLFLVDGGIYIHIIS